jgi:hypothetical protein
MPLGEPIPTTTKPEETPGLSSPKYRREADHQSRLPLDSRGRPEIAGE